MRASAAISGIVAALVGFGGTVALVIAAAQAVGAGPVETASWLASVCLATAAISGYLSLRHRMPIIGAWSTPGAALIAATGGSIGLGDAVGAFILAAGLILLTAAFRPLARAIERIPMGIAAAMLAGVLLQFVVALFDSAVAMPALVLPLIALFLTARLASPAGAVLAVLVGGVLLVFALGLDGPLPEGIGLASLTPIMPGFDAGALIGLGLPLYLVTMASQNLPGFAVLHAAGYQAPTRSILGISGLASLLSAPFGAHTTNLSAITAAICSGPDTHPDPGKRWHAGMVYAGVYVVLTLFGASLVLLFEAMPPALIVTVTGCALAAPLVGALGTALAGADERFAAVMTLVVTASGVEFAGIGSAFWGLLAGLAILGLEQAKVRFTG